MAVASGSGVGAVAVPQAASAAAAASIKPIPIGTRMICLPGAGWGLDRSSPSDPRVGPFTWAFGVRRAGVLTTRPRGGG
jgi:hypothetical protein